MKSFPLLFSLTFFAAVGCNQQESLETKPNPIQVFTQSIQLSGKVVFESWNGRLRGVDSDVLLHFHENSELVLEDRGMGVRRFNGSYIIESTGQIQVHLPNYREPWPPMILRLENGDLLLDREDGHTSWLPKDYPNPEPSVDGFWPFRSTSSSYAK